MITTEDDYDAGIYVGFGIHFTKLGCVVRMVVDSILPMRKAGQMTIAKTHPRLNDGFG